MMFRMEFVSELLESAREGQGEEVWGGGEGEGSTVTDGQTGYRTPVLAQKVHAPARCDSV